MANPDDLITQLICDLGYDEAEKVLRIGPAGNCGNSTAERLFEWIGAEQAVEKIVESRESESRRKNHGWIKCSERMPPNTDHVLTYSKGSGVIFWRFYKPPPRPSETWWQPKPLPPATPPSEDATAVAPTPTPPAPEAL